MHVVCVQKPVEFEVPSREVFWALISKLVLLPKPTEQYYMVLVQLHRILMQFWRSLQ